MTNIATDVEITRENAYDVQHALSAEEQRLRAELEAATDAAERAEVFRRAATNQDRQALACEARPGRTKDKKRLATQCRDEAQMCTAAADIEQLRAEVARRGRELPDPMPLLRHISLRIGGSDEAVQTVAALYTAAAESA